VDGCGPRVANDRGRMAGRPRAERRTPDGDRGSGVGSARTNARLRARRNAGRPVPGRRAPRVRRALVGRGHHGLGRALRVWARRDVRVRDRHGRSVRDARRVLGVSRRRSRWRVSER
jgi:hypothetical protein